MVKRTGTCFSLIVSSTLTLPRDYDMIDCFTYAILHRKYCFDKIGKTGEKICQT